MRKYLIILSLFLACTLNAQVVSTSVYFAPPPQGEDWYVRTSGGTYGSEDGTTYANAWDGFTNIAWNSIDPGDRLYVCGTHDEKLTIGASGTSGSPIHIYGNYNVAHDTIDGQDTRTECIDINGETYIHLESLVLTQATVSCLLIDAYSIVTTTNLVTINSGNQGVQHLGHANGTHTNLISNNNTDDGVSAHDTATVYIIGGTITLNADGVNTIADSHTYISGGGDTIGEYIL